jgi:hypothetical protein
MCKDAFGEEDQADEKTLAILKEFLAPHIDPQLLNALATKIGARISADTKKRIAEVHEHLNAAKAVLEDLHPGLADGREEEGRSDEGKSAPVEGTREPRSRSRSTAHDDEALKAHLLAKETVSGIEAVARKTLEEINLKIRDYSASRK